MEQLFCVTFILHILMPKEKYRFLKKKSLIYIIKKFPSILPIKLVSQVQLERLDVSFIVFCGLIQITAGLCVSGEAFLFLKFSILDCTSLRPSHLLA